MENNNCNLFDVTLANVILELDNYNLKIDTLKVELIKSYVYVSISKGITDSAAIAKKIAQTLKKNEQIIEKSSPTKDLSIYFGAEPEYKKTTIMISSLFRNPVMFPAPSKFIMSFIQSKGTKENTGYISNYQDLKDVVSIELVDATVPNFKINSPTQQRLFIKFEEFDGEVYFTQMQQMFAELLFKVIDSTSPFLSLDTQYKRIQKFRNKKVLQSLSKLTISIYNEYGELYTSTTIDPIKITSFSNTFPTTVTTSIAHGLVVGDKIFIRNFSNAYIPDGFGGANIIQGVGINNLVNQYQGWSVTNVTAFTFDIADLNLTSQTVLIQSDTETGLPPGSPSGYLLGGHSYLFNERYQFTFMFEIYSKDV
jgi:hypothetical protein